MLTTPSKIVMILIICLCLVACHSAKTVTSTTTEETEQSLLRHLQGTRLTSTLEILGDINFADSSPRFVPRLNTPAKLTMQQEHVNLADSTNTHETSFSNIKSVSTRNVDMVPHQDCLWIALSAITLIVIAIIVLSYCIRLFRKKILG